MFIEEINDFRVKTRFYKANERKSMISRSKTGFYNENERKSMILGGIKSFFISRWLQRSKIGVKTGF